MKRGYLSIGFFFFLPQPHSQIGPIGFINHGDFYVDFALRLGRRHGAADNKIDGGRCGCVGLCWGFFFFFPPPPSFFFLLFLARGVFHKLGNVTTCNQRPLQGSA